MKYFEKIEFIKEGEGVPLLNLVGGPGVLLLNFGRSWVPLLNFEKGPGSWIPRFCSHFYIMNH